MLIYNYDDNNIFTNLTEARIDPKSPDMFIIPAKATPIPFNLATIESDQVAVFNGASWDIVENHRGKTLYLKDNGISFVCDYIGPIKDEHTTIAKPSEPYYYWNDSSWKIDEEKMIEFQRKIRNSLLRNSDFTQLPDVPLTDEQKEVWKIYRQELRDFFEEWTVDKKFPEAPGE